MKTKVDNQNCEWNEVELPAEVDIYDLNFWRTQLFNSDLIGFDGDHKGYGNISMRYKGDSFIISGLGTGTLTELTREHYTIVTAADETKNWFSCSGPMMASSESLTHAVIYREAPSVNAIIHVHHSGLWNKLKGRVPTSAEGAAFESAEMAIEMKRILESTSVVKDKIMVMGGHQDGLIGLGKDFLDASNQIIRLHAHFFA